jgi:hypothetical protein
MQGVRVKRMSTDGGKHRKAFAAAAENIRRKATSIQCKQRLATWWHGRCFVRFEGRKQ